MSLLTINFATNKQKRRFLSAFLPKILLSVPAPNHSSLRSSGSGHSPFENQTKACHEPEKTRRVFEWFMVPEVGVEPTWGFPHWILSPARLPVSPLRHKTKYYILNTIYHQRPKRPIQTLSVTDRNLRASRTPIDSIWCLPHLKGPSSRDRPSYTHPRIAGHR